MNLEFRTARAAGPTAPRLPVAQPVPDYRPPQYVPPIPGRFVSDRHLSEAAVKHQRRLPASLFDCRVVSHRHDMDGGRFVSLSHWGPFPIG